MAVLGGQVSLELHAIHAWGVWGGVFWAGFSVYTRSTHNSTPLGANNWVTELAVIELRVESAPSNPTSLGVCDVAGVVCNFHDSSHLMRPLGLSFC